jgi:hypothetical protein
MQTHRLLARSGARLRVSFARPGALAWFTETVPDVPALALHGLF